MHVQLIRDDRGQSLAEYALIVAFVAVLCAAAVHFLGTSVNSQYDSVSATYP